MSDELLAGLTDLNKLKALLEQQRSGKARRIVVDEMRDALRGRVRGQDHVIDDLCGLIRREWGKENRGLPIASVLFLGPTGTGKTELAKAMAEYLYESESNMLYFACADFSGPEAKNLLIGVGGMYAGSEKGGTLTRPMLNNPRRLVLFDEVEKAYKGIFDLFLSMMGDGRLQEQGGRTADFTQAIIVLTSNAEHEAIGKIQEQVTDPHEQIDAVKKHLRDAKVFRPEILGRFDRVYVFKPLEQIIVAEIAALKMKKVATEYGLELVRVDAELVFEAMQKSTKVAEFGVRELQRIINEMLGDAMIAAREAGAERITISLDPAGELRVDPA